MKKLFIIILFLLFFAFLFNKNVLACCVDIDNECPVPNCNPGTVPVCTGDCSGTSGSTGWSANNHGCPGADCPYNWYEFCNGVAYYRSQELLHLYANASCLGFTGDDSDGFKLSTDEPIVPNLPWSASNYNYNKYTINPGLSYCQTSTPVSCSLTSTGDSGTLGHMSFYSCSFNGCPNPGNEQTNNGQNITVPVPPQIYQDGKDHTVSVYIPGGGSICAGTGACGDIVVGPNYPPQGTLSADKTHLYLGQIVTFTLNGTAGAACSREPDSTQFADSLAQC